MLVYPRSGCCRRTFKATSVAAPQSCAKSWLSGFHMGYNVTSHVYSIHKWPATWGKQKVYVVSCTLLTDDVLGCWDDLHINRRHAVKFVLEIYQRVMHTWWWQFLKTLPPLQDGAATNTWHSLFPWSKNECSLSKWAISCGCSAESHAGLLMDRLILQGGILSRLVTLVDDACTWISADFLELVNIVCIQWVVSATPDQFCQFLRASSRGAPCVVSRMFSTLTIAKGVWL